MYNVITILVYYFPMKNGCVCSVTWLTPLSAETRSPKFLYHDDLAVMNISCSFWNSLIISNVVVLALMQARGLGSGQWRHYLGGSTVFSPDISKAIRLGLMLLRTTPISFPFFRSCGRPGTLLYLMPNGPPWISGWQNWMATISSRFLCGAASFIICFSRLLAGFWRC